MLVIICIWQSLPVRFQVRLNWNVIDHPFRLSGKSRMGVVHLSWIFLTSWWLFIPLTMIYFWVSLGGCGWDHNFMLVHLLSLALISIGTGVWDPVDCGGHDGNNRFQLNHDKMEWLWMGTYHLCFWESCTAPDEHKFFLTHDFCSKSTWQSWLGGLCSTLYCVSQPPIKIWTGLIVIWYHCWVNHHFSQKALG